MYKVHKRSINIVLKFLFFVGLWQSIVWIFSIPHFLLPGPFSVGRSLFVNAPYLLKDAKITLLETILGLLIGTAFGVVIALVLQLFPRFQQLISPFLMASQIIPLYAIAPLLVLWLGYALMPKIVMVVIIVFFPITTIFYDALHSTPKEYVDLAKSLGASENTILIKVRMPAGLPALGSALRVATAYAPMGAIVGEWVGASAGLGYRMVYDNARLQIAGMFAALSVLLFLSFVLYNGVDVLIRKALPWHCGASKAHNL